MENDVWREPEAQRDEVACPGLYNSAVVALRFTLSSGSGAHIVCRDHNPLVRDLSSLCTELNYHQKWMHNWTLALDSTSEKMEKHLTSSYDVFTLEAGLANVLCPRE